MFVLYCTHSTHSKHILHTYVSTEIMASASLITQTERDIYLGTGLTGRSTSLVSGFSGDYYIENEQSINQDQGIELRKQIFSVYNTSFVFVSSPPPLFSHSKKQEARNTLRRGRERYYRQNRIAQYSVNTHTTIDSTKIKQQEVGDTQFMHYSRVNQKLEIEQLHKLYVQVTWVRKYCTQVGNLSMDRSHRIQFY